MFQIADLSPYCQYCQYIIEKVAHEQTAQFLNDKNIFYKYQFGFRSNHSTDLFLSFLNDKVFERFWQRNVYWHDSD